MAAVQAEDVRASFLFMGDLNGYYQQWFDSTTTNRLDVVPSTLQLYPVVISWLLAQLMHVEELLSF